MVLSRQSVALDGRVAVVIGGGAGIGRAIAEALSEFGARVAIWERDPDTAAHAADAVGGFASVTDVREEAQVDAAVEATVRELGTPSILVNNAGGVFWSGLLETSVNGWDALLKINRSQVLLCTQRVARQMIADGQAGSIVNITTIEGARAAPGFAAYAAVQRRRATKSIIRRWR